MLLIPILCLISIFVYRKLLGSIGYKIRQEDLKKESQIMIISVLISLSLGILLSCLIRISFSENIYIRMVNF